jgi:hypothetical protein
MDILLDSPQLVATLPQFYEMSDETLLLLRYEEGLKGSITYRKIARKSKEREK